jgi:mono/diheme cytochrome c family protein
MKNELPVFLLVISLLVGCHSSSQKTAENKPDSTAAIAQTTAETPANDSLTIYLPDLKAKGLLNKTQTILVADDPVFHKAKTFQAVSLKTLLETHTKLKTLQADKLQIVFECEDGYNPSMPLSLVLGRDAYLATHDADAPTGQDWVTVIKNGQTKTVAPFYVIYGNVTSKEHDYKWPYNLVKISLVETDKELAAIYPHTDDTMVQGFGLFQKNCNICHALNGVGGMMGPELNYPKSVTEYWRSTDEIKAFVRQPTTYRNGCKMPAVTYLTDKELTEIMRYLTYMAGHKVKPVG